MRSKKLNLPGAKGYRKLFQALKFHGKRIEYLTMETVEKIVTICI
jgi:hypothetical protein